MTIHEVSSYAALGALAPDPVDDTLCPSCRDPYAPHSSWCEDSPSPGFIAARAYYDGPDGTPCPVCDAPKPDHAYGCSEAPEGEPSYRLTPADFEESE